MLPSSDGLNQQMEMSRNVHDMSGIDRLRQAAQSGDKKALDEAAKQFEAIFVQMMLKSMRKAQEALADKDSPFNSEQVKFYRDMHDQQLAVDLSTRGNIGIAELIVQQLSPETKGFTPVSAIRNHANLEDIHRQPISQDNGKKADKQQHIPVAEVSKQAAFNSPSQFVQSLLPQIEKFADLIGLDPKALLAQAAVETGWGRFMIHKTDGQNAHNLFGIKADKRWSGESAAINTLEFEHGLAKRQKASFRAYDSFADGVKDYVSFVADNPRYKQAMQNAADPKAYFSALQEAGYATDPNYADKVMSVLNSDVLKSALSQIGIGRGE